MNLKPNGQGMGNKKIKNISLIWRNQSNARLNELPAWRMMGFCRSFSEEHIAFIRPLVSPRSSSSSDMHRTVSALPPTWRQRAATIPTTPNAPSQNTASPTSWRLTPFPAREDTTGLRVAYQLRIAATSESRIIVPLPFFLHELFLPQKEGEYSNFELREVPVSDFWTIKKIRFIFWLQKGIKINASYINKVSTEQADE